MDVIPARVGVATTIVTLLPGKVELLPDELVIWRNGHLVARAAYHAVYARRTMLSLGSSVRVRVGETAVTLDLSGAAPVASPFHVLPPFSTVHEIRSGGGLWPHFSTRFQSTARTRADSA